MGVLPINMDFGFRISNIGGTKWNLSRFFKKLRVIGNIRSRTGSPYHGSLSITVHSYYIACFLKWFFIECKATYKARIIELDLVFYLFSGTEPSLVV